MSCATLLLLLFVNLDCPTWVFIILPFISHTFVTTPHSQHCCRSTSTFVSIASCLYTVKMSSLKRKDLFIGYVHNLSSPGKGRKCTWFDMELQGPDNKRVWAVCFAKDKRTTLLEKQNTLSPVKISNFVSSGCFVL